jgi:hypothetical protein
LDFLVPVHTVGCNFYKPLNQLRFSFPLALFTKCWILIPTNLVPSLVTSSLLAYQESLINRQSFVNLNFVKRVSPLFHLLTISAQLIVCLPVTRLLLGLRTPVTFFITVDVRSSTLLCAGMRTGLFHVGRTVKERGELSVASPYLNTTTERELLSIVKSFKEFRTILMGQQLIVHTDHENLTYKHFITDRVMRWRLFIEEYSPDLRYIKCELNIVADALSRLGILNAPLDEAHFTVHRRTSLCMLCFR